jgi:hypothetical protein
MKGSSGSGRLKLEHVAELIVGDSMQTSSAVPSLTGRGTQYVRGQRVDTIISFIYTLLSKLQTGSIEGSSEK